MLIYIIIFFNILSFLLYGIDKRKAVKDRWRIPEKTLLLSRVPFSALGAIAGMKIFHHKTHKKIFWMCNIFLLFLQLAIALYRVWYIYIR